MIQASRWSSPLSLSLPLPLPLSLSLSRDTVCCSVDSVESEGEARAGETCCYIWDNDAGVEEEAICVEVCGGCDVGQLYCPARGA